MTNYPDNMGDDSHLDSDETGNKLSCGCYEEACECPKCKQCGSELDDGEEEWWTKKYCKDCEDEEE
tara:strand:+ start:1161 stop:1358 length:198 start_codon:yes stop_codon:yes gene_type:complete